MKILYNVTIKIDTNVHKEWLQWMKETHIPDMMNTGCFEAYKLTRIMDDEDEHGVGFAIQYVAPNMDTFQKYQSEFAAYLQKEHSDRFNDRYAAFRTLMHIESEGTL